ncbi:MAG: penicillin-binding protein 2 [Bacteroidetes bacterium]|nr:penicillin-binding protein 2 [Bacteroidota bacterium]
MTKSYAHRKTVIITIVVIIGVIYIARLFFLQVIDDRYKLSAENNVLRKITIYPARGLIKDRNGELLVYNEASYDLFVTPNLVIDIDTAELCKLLKIDNNTFLELLYKAKSYSKVKPSIFLEQISKEDFGYLEERLYKFPGFFVQSRTLRKYPRPIAAHILGYIGEVTQNEVSNNPYYNSGDYIGKNGIEKFYETELRGEKGIKYRLVDVFNREKGAYLEGRYDTMSNTGKNLQISIDAELQAYGELLMNGKKGSIVAIEPSTGEILSMVSSPAYDPNLLIGRIRSSNFKKLSSDSLEPLFNRAIMAQYPPGSTFKLLNALIGLNDGVLNSGTRYTCQGVHSSPIVCSHNHYSPLDLNHAIEQSCNPYFYKVFKSIVEQGKYATIQQAYENWRSQMSDFGVGQKLTSDIIGQKNGNLPDFSYFDKYYGKNGWKAITIRSLSIGQGEIEITPLQLANQVALIANRGYYLPPHFVTSIDGNPNTAFNEPIRNKIPREHYETVIEGMALVYAGESGTARWFRIDSLQMCGKTGTSENPFGENHAVFVAFAPRDNPKIAISVVVENSGFGATWAAPIASLMIEKYLNGTVKHTATEEKMLNTVLIKNKR